MPTHAEKRILPYQVEQIFDLVADVEKYPEFLPWILSANIISREPQKFIADLEIGYKLIRTTYRSEVVLTPHQSIDINYINGPFQYLHNHWNFQQRDDKLMELDFFIDFEFQASYLQVVLQSAFGEVVKRMIQAFEKRAAAIY
ncbi:type II toxin-antitoxin system RatA family toxin [Candidatus Paracaedibacter symbiosus]|uniref:type II toxin-antitoxin system RatA family toxin n=1 Tax=Candidatus Paracaedibacter symbiosus TaxID=244582 RepID=UPI000509D045|nr:type II toxin-antitoxin system RatA family toxin [Candidatus Paracaedibacter symbiosus]